MTARVLIRPKEGILDPRGQAVERALAGARVRGRVERARRPADPARRGRPLAGAGDVRAASGQPPDGGLRGARVRTGRVRFGVLRFPGSCDEVDALLACRRSRDAELIWHGDRDLDGVDAVVVPGGFSYGDYLRAGAIARFSPGDGGGRRLRALRRAGARHLQRLPGALRGGAAPGRPAPQRLAALRMPAGGGRGGERRHALHPRERAGDRLSIPVKHTPAATTRRSRPWTSSRRRPGGAPLRQGHNPNGSPRDIAGGVQRGEETSSG